MKRIVFDINPNNKLLCSFFIAVMPVRKVALQATVDIRISERHYCYAEVVRKDIMKLSEICDSTICYTDLGVGPKDFFIRMQNYHGNKQWWEGEDTKFEVVTFKKVEQLDIFSNLG